MAPPLSLCRLLVNKFCSSRLLQQSRFFKRIAICCLSSEKEKRPALASLQRKLMTTRSITTSSRTRQATGGLMSQYADIKRQYEGYLLLFQVGDFYELYDEDAEIVSSRTSLRVTKKQGISMAGFPIKSTDEWLKTLVKAGFQLAICNQTREKTGSRLLHRHVVQLVTPGTLLEPLTHQANYLLSVVLGAKGSLGLAWVDLSTSQFSVSTSHIDYLEEDLERIAPSEVLLHEDLYNIRSLPVMDQDVYRKVCHSSLFDHHLTAVPNEEEMEDKTELYSQLTASLSELEKRASKAVLRFIQHTQRSTLPRIGSPVRFDNLRHLAIDASSRRNLELTIPTFGNTKKATLFGVMSDTVTAGGERLLKDRLSSPLTDIELINRRLDCVELFAKDTFLAELIHAKLKGVADLERVLQKITMGNASMFDLTVVRNTLTIAEEVCEVLKGHLEQNCSLRSELEGLKTFPELTEEIESALGGTTHGYIRKGYSSEMDSLREGLQQNNAEVKRLTERLQLESGVTKLTVAPHKSYYRVFETTKSQSTKAEKFPELIKVEHLATRFRFTCLELQQLNSNHQQLQAECEGMEEEIFQGLCKRVLMDAQEIVNCVSALSGLDIAVSLGTQAFRRGYCRPRLLEDESMNIIKGRHPVIDVLQKGQFVCNDCNMNEHKMWIVTGPNMGGKSTFLRQNALFVVMAQMGSFVPADEAIIGVVDRLFARIGASDNVVKHLSTFHLEMTETAHILQQATLRSFVILDEIGRGTATNEGLSIAQAVLEHIQNSIGCRTLVATHFHTLSALCKTSPSLGGYRLVAQRGEGGMTFTYKVEPGLTDYSFGIDVAELSGVPPRVIHRAKSLLTHSNDLHNTSLVPRSGKDSKGGLVDPFLSLYNYIKDLEEKNLDSKDAWTAVLEVCEDLKKELKDGEHSSRDP